MLVKIKILIGNQNKVHAQHGILKEMGWLLIIAPCLHSECLHEFCLSHSQQPVMTYKLKFKGKKIAVYYICIFLKRR